ncbi:hypothetical protein TrLO_g2123 [Triparma laevis f. longispina]|uniref:Uncharacterized protein n=1 Tax=Triparma laevis f. longispina TaxID=1714387 RepID=A0A9W7FK75_9STRA|nr:hypothetical protein TrLO_g2123 [Triparma laevis f. longispina]
MPSKASTRSLPSKPTPTHKASPLTPLALASMALLSLQFGLQPFLNHRYTHSSTNKQCVIVLQEGLKCILAFFFFTTTLTPKEITDQLHVLSLKSWILNASLPSTIYSLQNYFILLSYSSLPSITFSVLNQTKTLSAAFFCYLILGRRQSGIQCGALVILIVSAVMIEGSIDIIGLFNGTSSFDLSDNFSGDRFIYGVLPCLIASGISGLAGAITQKVLQGQAKNSYLYSLELSLFSFIYLSVSLLYTNNFDVWGIVEQFKTLHPLNLIPIFSQALGGILVGLVTKYAGSVRKGFSLIFGIALTGVVQSYIEGKKLGGNEKLGGILVVCAMYAHGIGGGGIKMGGEKKSRGGGKKEKEISVKGKKMFKSKKE